MSQFKGAKIAYVVFALAILFAVSVTLTTWAFLSP